MMHIGPHHRSQPSPRPTDGAPTGFAAAPPLRPVPKRRASGDALPLASLQPLLPGPMPARHGFWQLPSALYDGARRALAAAWRGICHGVLWLLLRCGLRKRTAPQPNPPAATVDPKPRKSSEVRRARVSTHGHAPRNSRPLSDAPPAVQRWRDILDLFHIKLVGMRRAAPNEPQDRWHETCRSAHFVFRSGGFVRIYADEANEPRVLFNNRDNRKDLERVGHIVSHLRVTRDGLPDGRGHRSEARPVQRISIASFTAHMRATAAVAALPQWPVGRQPDKHPLPRRAHLPQLQDDMEPAPVMIDDVIGEEHTCFRDWGENERLLVAIADASNLYLAQPIMDVAVRRGSMRHLRMNEVLLRRYNIEPDVARTLEDAVLLQKLLSTLVVSMHSKWRVQLRKRQESYRTADPKLPIIKGAHAVSCYR